MILTEEDAKTKWCPFSRTMVWRNSLGGSSATAVNRWADEDGPALPTACICLGSGCMAWRWKREFVFKADGVQVHLVDEVVEPPIHGYCGLAGRPE